MLRRWPQFFAGVLLFAVAPLGCGGEKAGDGGGAASGETRVIEHALGETEVPENPRRVVTLGWSLPLDSAIALGLRPVGADGVQGDFAGWIPEEETEGITYVGNDDQPNLEEIASLEPDLIVGLPFPAEENYDELSQIAPTVVVPNEDPGDYDYRDDFRFVADVLGRQEQAEEVVTELDQRLEEFQAAAGGRLEGSTVALIEVLPGEFWHYGRDRNNVKVFEAAGLDVEAPEETNQNLSLEQLPELDADHLFVSAYGDDGKEAREEATSQPLWSRIEAAQRDQVYLVDGDVWAGYGMLWANAVLDDLEKHLLLEEGRS